MYKSNLYKGTGFILLILIISGFTLFQRMQDPSQLMNPPMDYEDYKKDWSKIDSLLNKGLPKSALELTETIYQNAKETHNHPQYIKATIYKIRLMSEFEEEHLEKTVSDLKEEIKISEPPSTQILHSVLAEMYWRYFQLNRYKFYERTMIVGIDENDIGTWDLNTLMNEIISHYMKSVESPEMLKTKNLKDFDAILETANDSKMVRPTLYDFLAHRAVDFFMNDESSLHQPAFRFELDHSYDFSSPSEFSGITYQTEDTLSLKYHALLIFQDLTKFHLNDIDPAALTDLNLKRLNFVHQHSILSEKDSLYLHSLIDFEKTVISHPSSTEISFNLASALHSQSAKYDPYISENYRWDAKNAAEKCREAIERFPESNGAKKCENLLSSITAGNFSLTIEKENYPEEAILSLLRFKNLDEVHLRIVQIDYSTYRNLIRDTRQKAELVGQFIGMPAIHTWVQELPNEGDFQEHKTEIKIPAMQTGHYVLLGSETEGFDHDSSAISYQPLWITRIGYISQNLPAGGFGFYILDRKKGTALKNVNVKLFYREYDYNNRSYKYVEGGEFLSDDAGYFEIPPLADNGKPNSFFMEFRTKSDHFITGDRFYHSGHATKKERTRVKTHFFTDRSIYRPGQTVYFKGIVLQKTGEKNDIKPGYKTSVMFLDVNHQKLSELDLLTSDYGSFHGSFTIPMGVLNGRMVIKTETGSKSILVEAYKRPNFEVTFNPIEGSYKLNEIISLPGAVKSFAGNAITDAEVTYRVVREVYYPWRLNYIRFFPVQGAMEIKNGTTQTDEDGNFIIDFKAIPNQTISGKFQPAFRYTVYADVRDINNETQSGKTIVRVGTKALKIELGLGEVENKETFENIPIQTTNLNGQPIPANGTVVISLLEEPDRLLREQLWKQPDVFVMEKESFIKDFPFDTYRNENEAKNLTVKSVISEVNFNTANDSILLMDQPTDWPNGRYKLEVSTRDEYGTAVNLVKYFILFDPGASTAPIKELNWFHVLDNHCEPGENAKFLIGTKDKKVRVLYEVIHKEKLISSQWMTLNNEQKLIEIPVGEEFRGGFKVNLLFVKHNRIFKNNFGVDVPYSNKKLDFEFITFRDKLLPGGQEEWMIRIKDHKGEKVAAELMAGMYDESLDQFTHHGWPFKVFYNAFHGRNWNSQNAFHNTSGSKLYAKPLPHVPYNEQYYDRLNWFGFNYYGGNYYYRGEQTVSFDQVNALPGQALSLDSQKKTGLESGDEEIPDESKAVMEMPSDSIEDVQSSEPQVRRDFKETAFFYPVLKTDEEGNVIISFKVPESLTRWKLMGLAHTKDLETGSFTKNVTTSKEVMVLPNAPRFFRQGDTMEFSSKIVNLSELELAGSAELRFFHTSTLKDITSEVVMEAVDRPFEMEAGKSIPLRWMISIPEKYDMISYRITAQAGNHSDGEEKPIPVLTNRMLVTESLPLPVNGKETKKFVFDKLVKSKKDGSLKNHKLTLEFSSNPAWYAVQALPYMMETTHESADNIFHRFYANTIAAYIVNKYPRIQSVFETWQSGTADELLSNLEKNEELKSLVLNETPWVRDAQNETERKQRIAILFDYNKMANEQNLSLRKLTRMQSPGGGWAWRKGMPDNRFITQTIVTGFGHLKQLGVFDAMEHKETKTMLSKAMRYLDGMIKKDYDKLIEREADMEKDHLGNLQIQYLYSRSYFYEEVSVSGVNKTAFDYYFGQAGQYWSAKGIYQKGMIALALDRYAETEVPIQILASIKEYALHSDEMGMYWRDNRGGYYWYQAPVEIQALLIEAFNEVLADIESVEAMKTWLLKQKQTQDWKTTRATAEAIFALLLRGEDWLVSDKLAKVTIGDNVIDPFALEDTKVEAGTGYYKTSWGAEEITPEMGKITVENENVSVAWGAMYWQYFEDLDKINFAETPLKLDKKLFVKTNSDAGPVLIPLEDADLNAGDIVIVRIELRVDRDMEYVHMKDMRASAFEPVNVLSGYRFQGGLGYYESTLDASTNFFFDYLRKGTYVFEYPLIASQKGDFSNGITTIQCMYAPEFTSHSEGIRVVVQ